MRSKSCIIVMRGILCACSIVCFFLPAISQAPGQAFKKLASVPLQSPQAASLSKYVEYPVTYYNGLAQISIPMYEIVSGDISVPISLSYHGGGIKVSEEASWVGLGWTLDAGGVITHQIKGGDDDDGTINHSFNQIFPTGLLNNYIESPFNMAKAQCGDVYTNTGASWDCITLFTMLSAGNADGEPDMYAYNFGNYSGKFFNGPGQFVDLSHNNIQFTMQAGIGFTAITPDGFKYEFYAIEKAWSFPSPRAVNTAYYLTKITSPRGKTVNFQYKSFKQLINENGPSWSNQYPNINMAWGNDETVMQLPSLSESFANYVFIEGNDPTSQTRVPVPSESYGLHQTYSSTTSSNLYLDKITFDLGWVDFMKSPRSDLYGVKLDAINISRGPLVKSIPFTYDYFVSTTGDDMYDDNKVGTHLDAPYDAHVDAYPQSFRSWRLKLLSVSKEASSHNFEYYEGDVYSTLPFKTSFAQDYWGYYNGKSGNPSLVPDYDIYSQQRVLVPELSAWQGANRNPDDTYIRAGSLKRIVYPTGGFSQFAYEMNEFSNLSSQQSNVYRQVRYGGVDAGAGIKKFYFTIAANTYCDISGGLYCNGMLDMNLPSYNCGCGYVCTGAGPNSLYAAIEKVDPNTHAFIQAYSQWQFDIVNNDIRNAGGYIGMANQLFTPGTYCITVNYPDSHTPPGDIPNNRRAELYVSFYELVPNQANSKQIGAGLRVSSIKNFDPLAMQMLDRKFTYSGGKIMRYPVFNADAKVHYSQVEGFPDGTFFTFTADYRYYYLYATPASPLSSSANGSLVGYDIVTETLVGPSSVGKTQYEYKNRPDNENTQPGIFMPGIPTTGYLDNGFLNRVAVFDNNNILLKETLNTQLTALAATYWSFKYRIYAASIDATGYSIWINELEWSFYPVQVGKILNLNTTVKDYANGNSLSITKSFAYNSNGLLASESLASSDGSSLTTNYSYASDYTGVSSGWIKDLKDRNMISIPLEIYNKRNGLVTGGTFNTYLTHDNIITPDKIYQIETTTPNTIASTVPNGTIPSDLRLFGTVTYNALGNLVQSRKENDHYTSYLWGYNSSYPVAKVDGVDYATINGLVANGTINPAVLSNPNISDATLRQELNNLRTALAGTNALITTYTYLPLVGMSSQTDERGMLTYFSYDNYNRLAYIRDQQDNILKSYSYFYAPGLKNVANSLVYNEEITKIFGKQCGPDQFGRTQISTDVPYTVPAGKYIGLNLQTANDAALAEINANGQANANILGDCYLYAGPLDLTAIENGPGTNVTFRYKCPFSVNFYCFIFVQDQATGALVGSSGGPISVSPGQTIYYSTNIPKGKLYKIWMEAMGSGFSSPLHSTETTIFLP